MTPPTLLWYRRDLRVVDHPALALAAAQGFVMPVYIVEPDYWQLPDTSARQWQFLAETLGDLRTALAALGQPLIIRMGQAVQVLETLRRAHGTTRMVSHRDHGHGWAVARDAQVADWARTQGVEWQVVDGAGRTEVAALPPLDGVEPGPLPPAKSLRLRDDPCPHRQHGGRARGLVLLDSFVAARGADYPKAATSPLIAERASSRLSPYLALGALTAAEVAMAPHLRRPLGRRARLLAGDAATDARMAAVIGETGLPFVDATMRYLSATGWLSFPLREMLASVGCHHLGLDPGGVGVHLARLFTDYEPAVHWAHMRRVAEGPVRDPVATGLAQDPGGQFIRRWLPELGAVPDSFLHEPWKWPGAQGVLGRSYPEPVFDPAATTRVLRAARRAAAPARRARRRPAVEGQLDFGF